MSFWQRNLCQHRDHDFLRTTELLGPPLQDAPCLRFREPAKSWLLGVECYSSSQEASLLLDPLQHLALQSRMRRLAAQSGCLGSPKSNTELLLPIPRD